MHSTGPLLAVFSAVYAGFALLAMSQGRHWHRLTGDRDCPQGLSLALRAAGYALLCVGLVLALLREGPGFGSLLWVTVLSLGAMAVVCTLTWRPQWLRPLARLLNPASRPPGKHS